MNQEKEQLEESILEAEKFIRIFEKKCEPFADDIIDKVCKRAIRRMNKEMKVDTHIKCSKFVNYIKFFSDDFIGYEFPNTLTFFDSLSILYQSYSLDEMGIPYGLLEDYILYTLRNEIDSLSEIEKLVFSYGYYLVDSEGEFDFYEAVYKAKTHFIEILNNHTSLVKIEKFLSSHSF